jgi:hypothetical protein
MKFDLELFEKLSKAVLYYMPKQLNWRCPRASSYLLYDLDTPKQINTAYNTGFPKWRELRNEIFKEIRRVEDIDESKRIIKIILFKHNNRSFCIPNHEDARKHTYFIMKASPKILISKLPMEKSIKHMAMPEDDYNLIPFGRKGSAWKNVHLQRTEIGSAYSIGTEWTSIMFPTEDTLYFYVETDL